MSRPMPHRNCCDGLCQRGLACPRFAPGVIDGPYRRGWQRRLACWWRGLRLWWLQLWRDA